MVDGIVYVASMEHYLYAVDGTDGSEIWRLDLGGALAASPIYADGHLYIGSLGGKIFDVSLDGQILAEFEADNWVWSEPVIADGVLFATDLSGYVYALDISNNLSSIWQTWDEPLAEKGIRGRPLVVDSYLVVAARDGNVFRLERDSGLSTLIQEVDAEILSDITLIESSDDDPLIIVSTVNNEKILVAFTLDGVSRWTYGR